VTPRSLPPPPPPCLSSFPFLPSLVPPLLLLRYLEAAEPFDRGFYAGPFGWVSGCGAEFAVAIRSAMLPSGGGSSSGSSGDAEVSDWSGLPTAALVDGVCRGVLVRPVVVGVWCVVALLQSPPPAAGDAVQSFDSRFVAASPPR
jgi:hypothetical protein